jgi:predicted ribosome quality control (RQC) complex YloA/Tae2 family protein
MIEIKNVTKKYGNKKAVNNVSFTVNDGDIFAFIGHNGAGKTTLIKSIVGIHDFDEGDILIDGMSIKEKPVECKKLMAFVPDNPETYEHMKAIDYINFICDMYDIDLKTREENIKKYAKIFDMEDKLNDTIDSYYSTIIAKDKFKKLRAKYCTELKSALIKINKSLKEMYCQVNKKRDADKFRLYGDLLMANLYNLKDYDNEASVFDYENNEQVKIPLKETKTVKENANDYYKKYNKSKTAVQKLSELIELNTQNKEYLESILYSLEIAQGIEDLKDIEQELRLFVKDDKNIVKSAQNDEKNKNSLLTKSQIFFIEKPDQTRIYIGKNNKQNDYIVSKLSSDDDLWFHTKDCPGSHVLLKSQNITDELILECANLAKKYSSASDSTKVGVIYTKRKYLRKPPKAALGYVTYKNEKEIIID